jgi:hypothetical protein
MIEPSVLAVSTLRFALGIADADRIGASAKVQAANPINRNRFMKCLLLGSRYLAIPANAGMARFVHYVGGCRPGEDSHWLISEAVCR